MRVPSVTAIQVQPSLNAPSPRESEHESASSGGAGAMLGVSAPWREQLWLLCANLGACGGIVGLSRLLPKVAEQQYDQHSHSAVLMFVVTFGVSKALCNLLVGALANSMGRRALLQGGWLLAALVPLLLWFATSWTWILWATGALGASQGFCTSGAVVMLMDIVPARARGVAMGALECTIYVSLGMGSLLAAEMLTGTGGHRAVLVVHGLLCAVGAAAAWRTKDTSSLALHPVGAGDAAGDANSATASAAQEERAAARARRRGRRSVDKLVVSGSVSDFESSSDDDDQLDRMEQQRRHSDAALSASAGLEWNSLRGDSSGGATATAGSSSGGPQLEPIALTAASTRHGAAAADSAAGSSADAATMAMATAQTPNGMPTPCPSDESAGSSLQQRPSAVASVATGSVDPAAAESAGINGSLPHSISGEGLSVLPSPNSASVPAPGFLAALWSSVLECSRSGALRAVIQAGFLNNFKDGVAWGLFPAFFAAAPPGQLGALLTAYPLVWGLGQLATGRLGDKYGRGRFVWGGLALQGAAMALLVAVPAVLQWLGEAWPWLGLAATSAAAGSGSDGGAAEVAAAGLFSLSSVRFLLWLLVLVLLGLGTAMSYPVLQAYIGDVVAPSRRASAIGLYRLCRDLGYAFGGVLSGRLADAQGVDVCLLATGALLAVSALYAFMALPSDEQASKDAQKQAR